MVIDRFGGPDELREMTVPDPTADRGQVLVQLAAAGINPLDAKMRDGSSGKVQHWTADDFPAILGREGVGRVVACGPDVDTFQVGDRVMGMLELDSNRGSYAELTCFPASGLAIIDEQIPDDVAAGSSLAGLTAWAAVHDLAGVTSEDVVLVQGGGGGVGQLIVQLAVATGAQVWATVSSRHHQRLSSYGARHIDYRATDFRDAMPRPSVIIDTVYFDVYEPEMQHLADGGRLVILPTLADLGPAHERGIDAQIVSIEPDGERIARIAELIAAGELDVHVGARLELDQAAEAHRLIADGHAEGKIVLAIA